MAGLQLLVQVERQGVPAGKEHRLVLCCIAERAGMAAVLPLQFQVAVAEFVQVVVVVGAVLPQGLLALLLVLQVVKAGLFWIAASRLQGAAALPARPTVLGVMATMQPRTLLAVTEVAVVAPARLQQVLAAMAAILAVAVAAAAQVMVSTLVLGAMALTAIAG